jgi:hypothetical protein
LNRRLNLEITTKKHWKTMFKLPLGRENLVLKASLPLWQALWVFGITLGQAASGGQMSGGRPWGSRFFSGAHEHEAAGDHQNFRPLRRCFWLSSFLVLY